MKKTMLTVLALMLTTSVALACGGPSDPCGSDETSSQDGWAKTENSQTQLQDGSVSGGASGGKKVGGEYDGSQTQNGLGSTSKDLGNKASDSQTQEQGSFKETGTWGDNYVGFNAYSIQEGSGSAKATEGNRNRVLGGSYEYSGTQSQIGTTGATNDGKGKAAQGGSTYEGMGESVVSAGDGSSAKHKQSQSFESSYSQLNPGTNGGYTYTAGSQAGKTATKLVAGAGGEGSAKSWLSQSGGSTLSNNGKGTSMEGASNSTGSGGLTLTTNNCVTGKASYKGTQTHEYNQFAQSPDGNTWQGASGVTSTTVKGSVNN